jgi:DNA polymerase III subunit epsilon
MLARLFSLEYRRRRLAAKTPPGPLKRFLSVPFPAPDADARELEYVALDLETTGLDPKRDDILSMGFVRLHGMCIDLGSAGRRLVRPTRPIPEATAIIHRILDDRAAGGLPVAEALGELLELLAGRVLVVHHSPFELKFLRSVCNRVYGGDFLMPTVDTEAIERRRLERGNRPFSPGQLRLANLREQYNLPRYRTHDALSDALAAAELFTAQMARRGLERPIPLKNLLVRP